MENDELFLEKIKEADSICIFSHHYPDGDCLGSMRGLKVILEANFPEKQIHGLAEPSKKWEWVLGKGEEVDDETIKQSLAIIVDHNSMDRVCDKRVEIAENGIRFDHHIGGKKPYRFPFICDEDAPSASSVILLWAIRCNLKIPKEAIQYLFIAFLDDCLQYSDGNAPLSVREIDGLFISLGGDKEKALRAVHEKSPEVRAYEDLLGKKGVLEGKFCYAIMEEEDYRGCGLDYAEAGAKSTDLGLRFPSAMVILLFTKSANEIRLSSRSRNDYSVEALCSHFGGGGHLQAAGATFPIDFDLYQVIDYVRKTID